MYCTVGWQSLRPRAECVSIWIGPTRSSARHDVIHGAEQAAVGHDAATATTAAPHSTTRTRPRSTTDE